MTIDERSRHQLYLRLEQILGTEEATTLMEHLPPVGWADVATKTDLFALEERMDLRFDRVEDRFARIDDRFERVEDRFARSDDRFTTIDDRFTTIEHRFSDLEERMVLRLDGQTATLRAEFQRDLRVTMLAAVVANAAIVSVIAAVSSMF